MYFSHRARNVSNKNSETCVSIKENALKPFKDCVLKQFNGIEFDVHVTLDNVFIVRHDSILKDEFISSRVYTSICETNNNLGVEEPSLVEYIPTLEDVLNIIESTCVILNKPPPILNIEIKPYNISERLGLWLNDYLKKVTYITVDTVVITSFQHMELLKIRTVLPNVRLGFLYEGLTINMLRDLKESNIDLIVISLEAFQAQYIRELKDYLKDLHVWVYTVNSPSIAKSLISHGVDCIITDIPDSIQLKGTLGPLL